MDPAARISLVILSYNRAAEVLRTLRESLALPERPPVIVVDNGSRDGAPERIAAGYPQLPLLRLRENIGAAARNHGVLAAGTPYVAFSDDDTFWCPGALQRAVALLDAHPQIAVLSARVLVGEPPREDPVCQVMARSPLPAAGLPGPRLIGFMAGACVVRREAFLAVGGYAPRFFIGGEEELLALDLLDRGWAVVYAPQLCARHLPSAQRDARRRRVLLLRNRLWTAWMRRALPSALAITRDTWRDAATTGERWATLTETLRGLPWALRQRRPVASEVEAWCRQVREDDDRRARALLPRASPQAGG